MYWAVVKRAIEKGWLGHAGKVATAHPGPQAADSAVRPIVVYTSDWRDRADIRRVLCGLRGLGVDWRLSYKTDQATMQARYERGVALYVSQAGSSTFDRRSMIR